MSEVLDVTTEQLDATVEQLDASEADRLAEDEAVIERGIATFVDIGAALIDIRDNRLYREKHKTFEAYLKDRWDFSRSVGYKMIDGFRATAQIEQVTGESFGRDIPVPSQKIASEVLAPIGRDDEQAPQVAEAWRAVVEAHEGDGPITTREAKRTLTEAGFISDTRGGNGRGAQSGLNEKLGAVGDALISAESRLAKVEQAMSRKPTQKFRAQAAGYADRAEALALRLRQWDTPAEAEAEAPVEPVGDEPIEG